MPISYKEIQSDGTKTDLSISVEGMNIILEMTYYRSGLHNIQRQGNMTREIIPLSSDPVKDTKVVVYLLDDPILENVEEPYVESIWQNDGQGNPELVQTTKYRTVSRVTKNEGQFIIATHREVLDIPYTPPSDKIAMLVTEFTIPAGLVETTENVSYNEYDPATEQNVTKTKVVKHGLDQCNIKVVKVV